MNRWLWPTLITLLALSCGTRLTYPPEVVRVLGAAGDNRDQLEQVLLHYASGEDTLKLQAAFYLIGNMEGHCYATYGLYDSSGNEVPFNVMDYPDLSALQVACDGMEDSLGTLEFERKDTLYDIDVITAEFLIEQIDLAFRAWREKPWAEGMPFERFRDYVLPYRGSNEPLEPWRRALFEKYAWVEDSLQDATDPVEAAARINSDVMTWFTFDQRFYYHPTDQGLSEMTTNGVGRCEDMTNLAIYAMRANGLGVTSDYTPHWANAGNNHAWNAIVDNSGNVIPFMGAEAAPGKYRLRYKLAKAYRKMFAQQQGNLIFQERLQEEVPGWLRGKSYQDVTSAYTDVSDVTVRFDREVPDSVDIAYLCVFNSGKWRAIHWGRIEGDSAVFTDMGIDVAYLPALYLDKEIEPFGAPFIVGEDGRQSSLATDTGATIGIDLTATTERTQDASSEGVAQTYLRPGKEYELFYWRDGWQSLGSKQAGRGPLRFGSVPKGGLYWLVAEDSDDEERIFTIVDGRQVWW